MEHTTDRHNFSETTRLGMSSPNNGFQAHVFFFHLYFAAHLICKLLTTVGKLQGEHTALM